LRYHLVWIPKYHKRILKGPVAVRLEALLRQACELNGWEAQELAIQPDHVHLLVQVQARYSVSAVMKLLKGGTSRVVRAEFTELDEFLWGDQFWADGFGRTGLGGRVWAWGRQCAATFGNSRQCSGQRLTVDKD